MDYLFIGILLAYAALVFIIRRQGEAHGRRDLADDIAKGIKRVEPYKDRYGIIHGKVVDTNATSSGKT